MRKMTKHKKHKKIIMEQSKKTERRELQPTGNGRTQWKK